jgi:hypothetical protein
MTSGSPPLSPRQKKRAEALRNNLHRRKASTYPKIAKAPPSLWPQDSRKAPSRLDEKKQPVDDRQEEPSS